MSVPAKLVKILCMNFELSHKHAILNIMNIVKLKENKKIHKPAVNWR